MRTARIAFEIALVAFAAYVLVDTYGLGPTARMVPWVIALPTLAMLLAVVVGELLSMREKKPAGRRTSVAIAQDNGTRASTADEDSDIALPFRREVSLFAGAVAWIAGLFAGMLFFGFYISVTVFLIVYYTVAGRLRPAQTVAVTLILLGIVWAVFSFGMGLRLFEGTLFGASVPSL